MKSTLFNFENYSSRHFSRLQSHFNGIDVQAIGLNLMLHWDTVVSIKISLSVCSFSYNGVYYDQVKLSVSDIIVSLKGSNGDRKLLLFEK